MAKLKSPPKILLNDKSDRIEYSMYIYKDRICDMLAYSHKIQQFVDNGDKVPARVLKKWFSFFEIPKIANIIERRLLLEKMEKQVKGNVIPRYDFSIIARKSLLKTRTSDDRLRVAKLPNRKGLVVISLQHILHEFYDTLNMEPMFNDITTQKGLFVTYAYNFLWSYLKLVSTKKHPSFYKQTIIIGYLALAFKLVDDKETHLNSKSESRRYSEYLHDQTVYICQKINKVETSKG